MNSIINFIKSMNAKRKETTRRLNYLKKIAPRIIGFSAYELKRNPCSCSFELITEHKDFRFFVELSYLDSAPGQDNIDLIIYGCKANSSDIKLLSRNFYWVDEPFMVKNMNQEIDTEICWAVNHSVLFDCNAFRSICDVA